MATKLKFFKNNLKKIRLSRGMTVQELSNRANMAQPNVTNIENNKVMLNLRSIELFSEILNCNPLEIICDDINNDKYSEVIEDGLITRISELTKDIQFKNDFARNKLIISLYNAFQNIKKEGIDIYKIEDKEINIIIKAIINNTFID